jgi:hypothetical protein
MGGAAEKIKSENFFSVAGREMGLIKKKKNKKAQMSPQAKKNLAAKSAAPLLQQTALSPDTKATGTGTALL